MSSPLQIPQGDSKTVNLVFTNDDGTPMNLSGYALYYVVKQNYTDPAPLFTITQTNHDVPVSGMTHVSLSGTQTRQCVGDYLAAFVLVSSGSGISTFETDGLSIVPSLNPF